MPLYTTPDGRYTYAIETPNEGDGNSVVYVNWRTPGTPFPVWDRWSYEAGLGADRPPVVLPPEPLPSPAPVPGTPPPEPALPLSRGIKIIPVTNASDGEFVPRMYSYWSNAWLHDRHAYVFAGHVDGMPRFFKVDLGIGSVEPLGPMLGFTGTTEGWCWTSDGWIMLCDGSRLLRVSPFTNEARVVFDIAESHPGCILWQSHSSDDGQTHSATVKQIVNDGAYPAIGTVVFRHGREEYFPAQGDLDESQIDPTGTYLVIKEDDDNRVINLSTRHTQILRDRDGAVGHSDCGPFLLVGEDNIHGACVRWDLNQPLTPGRRVELFSTWNMGYVSIRGGRCLHSGETHISLVALDGSGETPLLDHGVRSNDYDARVKANLDPSGRVATYMVEGQVFLLVLPT